MSAAPRGCGRGAAGLRAAGLDGTRCSRRLGAQMPSAVGSSGARGPAVRWAYGRVDGTGGLTAERAGGALGTACRPAGLALSCARRGNTAAAAGLRAALPSFPFPLPREAPVAFWGFNFSLLFKELQKSPCSFGTGPTF